MPHAGRRSRRRRWGVILASALTLAAVVAPPSLGAEPGPTLSERMADGRRALVALQAEMRADDAAVAALHRELKAARRDLKDVRAGMKQLDKERAPLRRSVATIEAQLADLPTPDPNQPSPGPIEPAPDPVDPTRAALQENLLERQARLGSLDRAAGTLKRQRQAKVARIRRLVAATKAAEERASGAAGSLWVQIERVTDLALESAVEHAGEPLDEIALPYQWPTRPRITQEYGCTGFAMEPARGACAHFHDGIDLGPGYGAEVGAAADGVVAYAGWGPSRDGDRAFIVVIAHADGNRTLYAHLQAEELVHPGQWVAAGETIGLVGNTGHSTGPHLHFEVTRDGDPIDPVTLIAPEPEPTETPTPTASATPTDGPVVGDAADAQASPEVVPPSASPDPATLDVTDDLLRAGDRGR